MAATNRLTAAERQEKADLAVEYSARGWTNTEIAEEVGVHRHTVRKLIDDELANRAEHRQQEKERAIAVYVAVQKAAWQRFQQTDNRSLNASGYLNTIKAAQERIDKVTGAEAPRKSDLTVRKEERSATEREAAELDAEIRELEKLEASVSRSPEEGEG